MKASQKLLTLVTLAVVLAVTACTLTAAQETPAERQKSVPVPFPVRASPTPESSPNTVSPSPQPTASTGVLRYATITPTHTPLPTATTAVSDHPWWNDTVFYEIFVRSFYDSSQDGIGDFNGLLEKLDYLNDGDPATKTDLGVTGIWLMPIHPSPSSHGYDVTDYYAVNPEYGSMEDFRLLVDEIHHRGMRIIIDLPLNHTSSQHPWFIQSQDQASPYRDWYVWSDGDPGYSGTWGQQVWFPSGGDYYYSNFWEGMPDLNYTNPQVTSEMQAITEFWLTDVGIDGFRLDAIGSLIEQGSTTTETQSTHDWFASYYLFYKEIKPDAMTVAEVWQEDAIVIPYVVNNQVDIAFEFDLAAAMLASVNEGSATRMLDTLNYGTSKFPQGQYGTFLTNHDMARVMTQLGGKPEKAKAAASLYLTLPGVPFIYYGEEIGMSGDAPDAMGRRPMQWTDAAYGGFSVVKPWMLPDVLYSTYNAADESSNPGSILAHYRSLIAARSEHPALRTGALYQLSTAHSGLYACLRATSREAVLVIVNLTGSPISDYSISLRASTLPAGDYAPDSLLEVAQFNTLTVEEFGRISNYVPLAEIPSYTTILMSWVINGN